MAEDQIYEPDQVTTGDPDPLRRLYDVVFEKELYTKGFDEFKKKYSDPAERDKLYAVVSDPSRQLYRKSREEFEAKYFSSQVQAPKFELLRKMPSTSGSSESTSVAGTMAASIDRAAKAKPTQSGQEKLVKDIDKAQKTLKNVVATSDDVVADMIREGRYIQATEQGLNQQMGAPRSDIPGMQAPDLGRMGQPEVKPQDLPVSEKDIADAKVEIDNNPQYARHMLQKVREKNPEKGKETQASLYLLDAVESTKDDPNAAERLTKIMQNAEKLKKGEYQYNETAGRLERPEGFLDGIITGLRERTKQMGDYKTYQQDDATVIKILEEELNTIDDEPVPVPAGMAGEFGSMLGMEGVAMGKSGAATAITGAIPGGQAAAPFVGAAVSGPEYYQRGYATALKETYAKLRAEGKAPEEALATARAQANDEGWLSAAEGAVSAAIGGRIGLRPLPKFNFTGSFAKAANNVLKQTVHYGKEATLDGLTDGLVAGYLQEEKNIAAKEKGIHREEGEGIWENIKGELMFSLGVAGVTKAGKVSLDPKTYQTLLRNVANQDPQQVDKALGEMVVEGKITEEDAAETKKEIVQQKQLNESIPEDVTEEARGKIEKKIAKRTELESEMEKADKAFHPEIKEKIKAVNEDIVELSKEKEPAPAEPKAEEAKAEAVRVPEPVADEEKEINVDPETADQLVELGYSKKEIDKMTPDYADQLATDQLPREMNSRYTTEEKSETKPIKPLKVKTKPKAEKPSKATITDEEARAIAEREMGKIKENQTQHIDDLIAKPPTEARDSKLKVSLSHAEDMISNATEFIDQFKKSGDQKQVKRYEDMLQQYTDIKNKIVGAIGEQPKAQEETPASTPDVNAFKQHVFEQFETQTGSDAGRLDIPGMQPNQVRKAVADIRAGRTNASTRKLEMALKDITESGQVPLIQGTGGHSQRVDVPFSDYMKKITEPETHDIPIDTPEALESELTKLFMETPKQAESETTKKETSNEIGLDDTVTTEHAGATVTGKVIGQKEDGRWRIKAKDGTIYLGKPGKTQKVKPGGALPKHASAIGAGRKFRPKDDDSKQYTPQSIIEDSREYFKEDETIQRVADFLEPIIKANPSIRIDHEAKIEGNIAGYSYDDGRIELNFDILQDYDNLYRTALHEMVHAATRFEIENNPAFRAEIDKILSKARAALGVGDSDFAVKAAQAILNSQGNINLNLYGVADAHELVAEIFTSPDFREFLAGIKYEDTGDNLLVRFFKAVAEWLSKKYKQVAEVKQQISADNLADYIMQLTEGVISGRQGDDSAGALPMAKPINTPQAAIKKLIKQASPAISDEKLLEVLHNGSGINKDTLQQWIDEIRHPPPPSPPSFTTADLSPEERKLSVKKIKNLRSGKPPKKPGWWQRNWTNLKNLSAWIENPYRFVTKITEDIRREYKISRKERSAIPLGRAFEKNAAGRAALKVQAFVDEVLGGKIGKERYGKLKEEKLADFQDYLSSKRVIDRLKTERRKREEGENVSRGTKNITELDAEVMLEELEKKYGPDGMKEFEARGDAFQKHMDKMLQRIQAAGIISEDAYNQIKEDNDFYAPFSIIQEKLLAEQDSQPVGISGVVKRIQGMSAELPTDLKGVFESLNTIAAAVAREEVSPEEYFRAAVTMGNNLLQNGAISQTEYDTFIARLEQPGFYIQNIIDAAANMIYKAEGMALKNTTMQRIYSYKKFDTKGMFIQDVEGFKPTTMKGGEIVMVPKPLNTIPVEPGMAPIKLMLDGKPKIVAVNKQAAEKLNTMSNFEVAGILKASDWINRLFRAVVITVSPGFQAVNLMIDFIRTTMLSRYGLFAGKGLVQPLVNALLYIPQYVDALIHSAAGNLGAKTDTYKQWMESDSFSKGMFDNLFDNEKSIKEMTAPTAKRTLMGFLKLFEVPGTILEQTHKLAIHQRGSAVEGLNPKSITGMLAAMFNKHVSDDMTKQQLSDAADRLNYEVQNFAGSPNFPQTHKWMKLTSLFLQFFSARVKGEVTDYRRVANLFTGRGEGVKLSAQERTQMIMQFAGISSVIVAYAMKNLVDDDDEKEFDSIPQYHQANYMNIPAGEFVFEFEDGARETLRDYIKIPLRGLTASLNVVANSVVRYAKHQDPKSLKQAFLGILGNASPVNLHGNDEREFGESLVSNMTPVFKYYLEYSFNRDTHKHRDIINEWGGEGSKLEQYKAWRNSELPLDERPGLAPWKVVTNQTPQWCAEWSKFIYDNLGIEVAAATLDHIENTMGNPTELLNNPVKKRLVRSQMKYPVAGASGKVVEEDDDEETENEE